MIALLFNSNAEPTSTDPDGVMMIEDKLYHKQVLVVSFPPATKNRALHENDCAPESIVTAWSVSSSNNMTTLRPSDEKVAD